MAEQAWDLQLSKHLIKMMKGTINLSSKKIRGAALISIYTYQLILKMTRKKANP